MQDILTQKDLDLFEEWGACKTHHKIGQPLSEITIEYRNWAIIQASKYGNIKIVNRLLKAGVSQCAIDNALWLGGSI